MNTPLLVPIARIFFAVQAALGVAWWVLVFSVDTVRQLTLGSLDPMPIAVCDVPLFIGASAVAAWFGRGRAGRVAALVAAIWTSLVAAGMATYATATTLAGLGAVAMMAAAACSIIAAFALCLGRVPTKWLLFGPFRPRPASHGGTARNVSFTGLQIVAFWGVFLVIVPIVIAAFEERWQLAIATPLWLRIAGIALLIAASVLGLWSGSTMATSGKGTPLPAATARELVVTGPYKIVRNPMAVSGFAQAAAVGLLLGSWLVVMYAIAGAFVWNYGVRPHEEADLGDRFGGSYADYRDAVDCWWPRS